MRYANALRSWFRSLLRRERVEHEIDAELQFHLEEDIAEYVAAGHSPAEARAAALRSLGSLAHIKDACRESLGMRLADALGHDLRHTARSLRKQPGFTLVVVLSLALGIGANTAVFQLINAVRLRTLPVPEPQELASVRVVGGNHGLGLGNGFNSDLTFALWQSIRDNQAAFSGIFAWGTAQFPLGSGADTQLIDGLWVSGDLFRVLRLSPARGRLLTDADDRPGCDAGAAVLSHAFWQSHFGGDESVLGKTLSMRDRHIQIVGIAPKGFFGLEVGKRFDVALPICAEAGWRNSAARRDVWWLAVMGRLKRDWSVARAAEHLNALSPALFAATAPTGYSAWHDKTFRNFRLSAVPAGNGSSRLRNSYDAALWLLLAMTGIVLLVASVNLANLMLARATARQREIAVRIAIGASRRRVLFQFLIEGIVLAMAGGALGVVLSDVLSRGLIKLLDTEVEPVLVDISADWRVLAFTAAVCMATCLLFSLAPALRSLHVRPLAAIRRAGRGVTIDRESLSMHRVLVAVQIALTLMLLAGACLFVRSFRNLATLDAGFREKDIVFMSVDYSSHRLPPAQRMQYRQRLLAEVRRVPGVASAALTTHVPLSNASWTLGVHVPGTQGEEVGDSKFTYISPHYFATMETRLVAGRDFTEADRTDSLKVAIVNETFIRRYVRTPNPLGVQLRTVAEPGIPAEVYEIVGIVKDTKYGNLREDTPPMTFVPTEQNPQQPTYAMMAIRSAGEPDVLIGELRAGFRSSHPDLPVRLTAFERDIRDRLSRERLMAWLAGFFGTLAAILAAIGLYGLISYVVQRRGHEIAIRMALGATSMTVVALVLRQTAFLIAIGVAAGIPASMFAARSASSLLFGLSPHDFVTLAAAAGLLMAVSAFATIRPAWRAVRIDPIQVLRDE